MSREHTISASLFLHEKIMVQGLSWCMEEAKEVKLGSLASKVLCTYHNNSLSPVDQVGSNAFAVLRESTRIRNIRGKLRGPFGTVIRHKIDGNGLERWFLKTLINLCYHQNFSIGSGTIAGRPSEPLVKVAYGLDQFRDNEGLYSLSKQGMQTVWEDRFAFKVLRRNNSFIEGGIFFFRGLIFLLWFGAGSPPVDFPGLSFMGHNLTGITLMRHIRQACDGPKGRPWQVITFNWY